MSRIRTIKPEFNTSKSVARMTEQAQLFMLKLLTECDDHGRLEWIPKKIAGNLYPHSETATGALVESYAKELVDEGILLIYGVGDDVFACFVNWDKHQKVDRPSRSKFPEPPATAREQRETFENDSRETREDSSGDSRGMRDTPEHSSTPEVGSRKGEVGSRNLEGGGGNAHARAATAEEVLGILREVPGYARATGATAEQVAEVIADFPDLPEEAWPPIARELRDQALERPVMKANSIYGAPPAADLRKFVRECILPRLRPSPSGVTATRKPGGRPSLSELREEARELHKQETTR
jgi:hypothetical protein